MELPRLGGLLLAVNLIVIPNAARADLLFAPGAFGTHERGKPVTLTVVASDTDTPEPAGEVPVLDTTWRWSLASVQCWAPQGCPTDRGEKLVITETRFDQKDAVLVVVPNEWGKYVFFLTCTVKYKTMEGIEVAEHQGSCKVVLTVM